MQSAPAEYLFGKYFGNFRKRFKVCGTKMQPDGTWLVLKCLGCNEELSYDWLKKLPQEEWTGDFGEQLKRNLTKMRTHQKACKQKITEKQSIEEEKNRLQNERDELVRSTDKSELKDLKKQLVKSEEKYHQLVKTIKKQKIKVKKPAMTQRRRLTIAASQDWNCNKCSKKLSSCFEIDHIERWSESFDDSDENLQALCVECHWNKTAEENREFS